MSRGHPRSAALHCFRLFCSSSGPGSSPVELAVGDRVTVSKRVDRTDVVDFARISGDTNPVHSGDRPLVHGVYLSGLVSGVIGTRLPGPGTLLVSKSTRFPRACYAGDLVRVEVEVLSVRKLIRCGFRCTVRGEVVMHGTADVVNGNVTAAVRDPRTSGE